MSWSLHTSASARRRAPTRRAGACREPAGGWGWGGEPVYPAGKGTEPSDRPIGDAGAPVIDVDRGGKITWHGPGQLTGYPIIKLREPIDVVGYVRALEEALIQTCAQFGVTAERIDGRSGSWVTGGGRAGREGGAAGGRGGPGGNLH